ncbi:MAG: DUF1800 family protein [Ignavibacteria bacterium]|jgi:uncharacterized protein (DUF1800 family)
MNRRELFTNLVRNGKRGPGPFDGAPLDVQGGLDEYTQPLTLDDIYHLYRRMSFGISVPDAQKLVGKTAAEVVDALLGPDTPPDLEKPIQFNKWRDPVSGLMVEHTENPQGADLQTRFAIEAWWRGNHAKLSSWWMLTMVRDTTAIEKITMFWMSHWVTEFSFDEQYLVPQSIYNQYLMLRNDRLGEFRKMALDVTLDNAMLHYLGGTYNEVGRPNENFARELMELHTTGIGWYTEGDVQQAARVLTGWKASRFNDQPAPNGMYVPWFDANKHDIGAKEFMGVTIPARTTDNNTAYQVRNEEVGELINILFRMRPEAISRFMARKVYLYFVYSSAGEVDPLVVDELAAEFRASDFKLRPLFRKILTSAHFFDPALRGAQIKTPLEYVTSLVKLLRLDDGQIVALDLQGAIRTMDQTLYDAPNVAGWPGYRTWISTNTYPRRRDFARRAIDSMTDAKALEFIKEFPSYDEVDKFVAEVARYMLPVAVSAERLAYYKATLLEGQPDYTWAEKLQQAASASRSFKLLLKAMAVAPDFQLC